MSASTALQDNDAMSMFSEFSSSIKTDVANLFDAEMGEHVAKTVHIAQSLQKQQ